MTKMRRSKAAKPPKPKGPTEHQIQVALFDWLKLVHPGVFAFAVPNAAKRSVRLAAYLKAEGLRPGVPDVVIAQPVGRWPGMYLELKSENGVLSVDQEKSLQHLMRAGYACAVAYSIDEARDLIEIYLRGIWDVTQSTVSKH